MIHKKILTGAIAGLACLAFSLQADEAAVKAAPKEAQSASSAATADQGEIAAWKIETAQVGKDYVEGLDKGDYAQAGRKEISFFSIPSPRKNGKWP